ncbi:hypothetical protein BBP40_001511 [Aspergillus hancockii]|nr:hypothetical protein BBP40_001511 [Aspergillus hancockii]
MADLTVNIHSPSAYGGNVAEKPVYGAYTADDASHNNDDADTTKNYCVPDTRNLNTTRDLGSSGYYNDRVKRPRHDDCYGRPAYDARVGAGDDLFDFCTDMCDMNCHGSMTADGIHQLRDAAR